MSFSSFNSRIFSIGVSINRGHVYIKPFNNLPNPLLRANRNHSNFPQPMAFRSYLSRKLVECRDKSKVASSDSDGQQQAYRDAVDQESALSGMAVAFEELTMFLKANGSNSCDLGLKPLCEACSLVSVLFGCLGIAFKFAELEYVSKVRDLTEASGRYETVNNILDIDVKNNTVRSPGSHSRNLRRVRQGLDLIRAIFLNFVNTNDYSLKDAASSAYAQVCAPYHSWTVRTAVSAGMCALPTRDQLLTKLNETEDSAEKEMKRYINASLPVIQYIDALYISRNITLDW